MPIGPQSFTDQVFTLPGLTIRKTREVKDISNGQTATKNWSSGTYHIYEVDGVENCKLKVAYAHWDNGEVDIRVDEVLRGSRAVRRLETGGLRLGIFSAGPDRLSVELRQARVDISSPNLWSTLRNATWEQLDEGSGLDAFGILSDAGAVELGTKEEVLNDRGKTRNRLCTVFRQDDEMFPILAFIITRVLPLLREYPAEESTQTLPQLRRSQ